MNNRSTGGDSCAMWALSGHSWLDPPLETEAVRQWVRGRGGLAYVTICASHVSHLLWASRFQKRTENGGECTHSKRKYYCDRRTEKGKRRNAMEMRKIPAWPPIATAPVLLGLHWADEPAAWYTNVGIPANQRLRLAELTMVTELHTWVSKTWSLTFMNHMWSLAPCKDNNQMS